MSRFIPPRPAPMTQTPSLLARLRLTMGSSLSLFFTGSFKVDVGRYAIPTLPWFRRRMMFTVREPSLARQVLVRSPKTLCKSAIMDAMLRDLTGVSIFTSTGDTWARQRRVLDQAFEQAGPKAVFPMMRDACEAATAAIADHARTQPGAALDIDAAMTFFAADVIFRTLFSEAIDPTQAKRIFAAFAAFQKIAYLQGMLSLIRLPRGMVPGAAQARRIALEIRALMKAPLDRRLAALREGRATPEADILGAMVAAVDPVTGERLGERELLDQITMLFLAGHETSASALSWTLYLLANDPGLQARLRAEGEGVRGGQPIAFEHLKRLTLTRDVFREALRLYPPVAFLPRDVTESHQLGDRSAPAGSVVFVAPWLLQRHAKHWPDPDAFDPDRFATPQGAEGLRCAYLPFSMGERVCVGAAFAMQEATLLLTTLVQSFALSPAPGHTPQPVAHLTLRSANGVRLRITPRS